MRQPPTLPPLPVSEPLNCTIPSDLNSDISLLTIPSDIRRLIFDAILPFGPLIVLHINAHATRLEHLYALAQTCHLLHNEIALYLTTRPLTILSSSEVRPNILSGVSTAALATVETLVIEDFFEKEPIWALIPNLKTICFTDTHFAGLARSPTLSTPIQPLNTGPTDQKQPPIHLTWPTRADLPSNNKVLAYAHRFWQDLRLNDRWVYNLWKREPPFDAMPRFRVLLRCVVEAAVARGDDRLLSWHGVVDVDSRKVVENCHLAMRTEGDDLIPFPYGAQTWWRKELGVKGEA